MSTDSIRADGVPARRPWRPAAAIKASAVLHAGAVVALAAAPEAWGVVLAAIAANHAVLFGASLAPRSGCSAQPDAAAGRGRRAESRSRSTTAPIRKSRRACSTGSTKPA
jgi:hypothetical protein